MSEDAVEVHNRLARMMGRAFGIDLGVIQFGDRLVFVDENDDPVAHDGVELLAATQDEVEDKTTFGDFPVRALRAAMVLKSQEIERSRS